MLTGDDAAVPVPLAAADVPEALPDVAAAAGPEGVKGLDALLAVAKLAPADAAELTQTLVGLGVVHVSELLSTDWASLDVWGRLLEFQRRRILTHTQPVA